MVFSILHLSRMEFFCIFAGKIKKHMTQKEAIVKALEMLGGRANLKRIYPLAMELTHFGGNTPENTIRNYLLKNPKFFRSSPGKPSGWWELVSFQEEIAEMQAKIQVLEDENEKLRNTPTEEDFVKKLVKETKKLYKHEKDKIEVVRQILYKVGRNDAEEELDAWIEGKEYKSSVNVTGGMHIHGNLNDVHNNNTVNF